MPVQGGFLRTNYRTTGAQLAHTAIGGGYPYGSVMGGSNLEAQFWGGFIINSVSAVNTTFQVQPLTDMIYSYWGGGYDSGYRIVPIGLQLRYASASVLPAGMWFSMTDSTDSTINVGICVNLSQSGAQSSYSGAIIVAGFICSAPGIV